MRDGAPEVLRGKRAVGLQCVLEGDDSEILAEDGEAQLERLAASAGLELTRTFTEKGWAKPIADREEVVAALRAVEAGEAEVVVTFGPTAVGPTVGEHQWFFSRLAGVKGLWWMGGGGVVPRQEGEPTFGEELEQFRQELEGS